MLILTLKFELTGTQETDAESALNQEIKLDGGFIWKRKQITF